MYNAVGSNQQLGEVIGSGLLAKAFRKELFSKPTLIFASGVSDSLENRESEFDREIQLIEKTLSIYSQHKIVYFSSNICGDNQINTPYVQHKRRVEQILIDSKCDVAIFRLPQIVGCVKNNTLVSYLVRQVAAGSELQLKRRASRNILDVSDVKRLVVHVLNSTEINNLVLSLGSGRDISVIELAKKIAELLQKPLKYKILDGGDNQEVDTSQLSNIVGKNDLVFKPDYYFDVLAKYVVEISLIHD